MSSELNYQNFFKCLGMGICLSVFTSDILLAQPQKTPQAFSIPKLEVPKIKVPENLPVPENLSVPEAPRDLLERLPIPENNLELPQNPLTDFHLPQENTEEQTKPLEDIKDKKYWIGFCNRAVLTNDTETALTACDKAISLTSKNPDLWANRSKILLDMQQYTEAIAAADYTLQLEPEHSLALTYRSVALVVLRQYQEAIDNSEQALRLNSYWSNGSPALAWYNRGLALANLQDYELALASYDGALKIEPEYSLALARKCQILSELNQQKQAITACDRRAKISPVFIDS